MNADFYEEGIRLRQGFGATGRHRGKIRGGQEHKKGKDAFAFSIELGSFLLRIKRT